MNENNQNKMKTKKKKIALKHIIEHTHIVKREWRKSKNIILCIE